MILLNKRGKDRGHWANREAIHNVVNQRRVARSQVKFVKERLENSRNEGSDWDPEITCG